MREKYRNNENFRLFVQIFVLLLLSRLLMLLMVPVYNGIMGTDRSFRFLMNEWDAKRYAFIIEHGYTFPLDTDPQANWAFFPLFVIVSSFVKLLTFNMANTYDVGMFVSNVCIFVAAFVAVKYMQLLRGGQAKKYLMLVYLLFFAPYSFYFASVYTEAMFVLFIVLFFYQMEKKRYIPAGCMAAAASATRIVGCLLVFALLTQLFLDFVEEQKKQEMLPWKMHAADTAKACIAFIKHMLATPQKILAVMLTPLGAFIYMAFLYFFCGDVWAYKNVQIAWREDTFVPIVGVMWKACTGQIEPRYTYMGWFCVAMFVIYGYMLYKKYTSQAIFGMISLLVPLTSHVMSTCRFTVGTFVIYIGVYEFLTNQKKIIRWLFLCVFGIIEIWLLFLWYNSDCWLM